jgi:hypothetical protein
MLLAIQFTFGEAFKPPISVQTPLFTEYPKVFISSVIESVNSLEQTSLPLV